MSQSLLDDINEDPIPPPRRTFFDASRDFSLLPFARRARAQKSQERPRLRELLAALLFSFRRRPRVSPQDARRIALAKSLTAETLAEMSAPVAPTFPEIVESLGTLRRECSAAGFPHLAAALGDLTLLAITGFDREAAQMLDAASSAVTDNLRERAVN